MIIADFAVQGTLAREVLGEPSEIMCKSGLKKPLKMSVEAISFSAHADYPQVSCSPSLSFGIYYTTCH